MGDIEFFDKDRQELELMEKEGMYPPRFHVVFTNLSTTTTHHAKIVFEGAVKDLKFPIPLIPSPISPCKWPNGCGLYTKCISFPP